MNTSRAEAQRPSSPLLADANTPLIRNAWYVVATSEEVSRTLIARDVMETSVVMFRKRDGQAVVLQNRCCHRSFPLVNGTLEDDTLRCGYHGLRYDYTGRCVEIPMQSHIPPSLVLRAFPVVERPPLIWAWFGAPTMADESLLPQPAWLGASGWSRYTGYLHIKGSYVHMHENLLDLSHLSFLHAKTFGTPEYARAPVELSIDGEDIQAWRHVTCELPDIYAVPLKWQGMKVLRSSGSQYVAPGLHVNTGILKNLELPDGPTPPIANIKVAQIITPESKHALHYWFIGHRDFAHGRPDIDEFMTNAQYKAFAEDQFAIEAITRLEAIDIAAPFAQSHIPTDAAGIAMRKRLKALAGG